MQKRGIIFLTSTGFSSLTVYNRFLELANNIKGKKAVIITTAAENKENNKYSQLAMSQFLAMGLFKVDFCDLENEPDKDLSIYDVIYVCGGNTFKLLKYANIANFKNNVVELLRRGGIYLGVSAGSIILGPSIKIAGEIQLDINDVGLTDFKAFSLINFAVLPHYSNKIEKDVVIFEKKEKIKVEKLADEQAIIINGDSITRI